MHNKGSIGIISMYLQLLGDSNVVVGRGSAMALGILPNELMAIQWRDMLLKLCSYSAIEVVLACGAKSDSSRHSSRSISKEIRVFLLQDPDLKSTDIAVILGLVLLYFINSYEGMHPLPKHVVDFQSLILQFIVWHY